MARPTATPVAQVDVRIGETTLERVCVHAGEQIWVGSHPGAALAIAGVGAFPLVRGDAGGFVVRVSFDREARLAPGEVVTARFGIATVEVRLEVVPAAPVPRPPVDARPPIYTALSLVAHVCIWAAAAHVPLPAPRPHRVVARLVRHPREPAPVPKPVAKAIAPPAPARPSKAPPRPTHRAAARPRSAGDAPLDVAAGFIAADKAIPAVDWKAAFSGTGDIYRPDEAGGFGQQPRFRGTGTIPAGPYAAAMSGNPLMYCVTTCRADGPLDLMKLSDDLEGAWPALAKCNYTRGPVILMFTIAADGRVGHVETEGAGADCAATIVAANRFRAMPGPTEVMLSLGYK